MLSMHESGPGALIVGDTPGSWIDLCEPGPDEVRRAAELTGVDERLIEHALDLHECPRIEVDDEATLLILRAPFIETRQPETRQPAAHSSAARHSTLPIGVILTRTALITVCRQADPALADILRKGRGQNAPLRPEHLICGLIKGVAQLFMHYLKDISARIQEVEQDLARSRSNDDLKILLALQKSVTYFHSALKTNDFIIDRLLRKGLTVGQGARLCFTEDEVDGLDDALTDTRQGIYMSKIFNEVLNSISSVYSSIISNSVNQIMKVLTSLTVVLMIPTLVTSMYGMNISLPLQNQENAFGLVALGTAAITTAIIVALKRSRML